MPTRAALCPATLDDEIQLRLLTTVKNNNEIIDENLPTPLETYYQNNKTNETINNNKETIENPFLTETTVKLEKEQSPISLKILQEMVKFLLKKLTSWKGVNFSSVKMILKKFVKYQFRVKIILPTSGKKKLPPLT